MVIAGLLAALLASLGQQALASVTLTSFTGVWQADRSILIRWVTAGEIDTVAFRLYRSEISDANGTMLTTVPHKGDPLTGASYSYTDPAGGLVAGRTYYYRLEEIDEDSVSSWFGPVSVQAAPAPISYQQTLTPTEVPTATRRFTNTPVLPTAAPTTPTPPPLPTRPRPPVTRAPSGPVAVTTPTVVPGVVVAPPPPTATPFVPTASPTLLPTDTPTVTPSPTLRPSATPSRTPAPLVFAAQGAGEAPEAAPMATAVPTAPAGPSGSVQPMLLLAGAAVALAVALGLLAAVMRRSARA
jgi:hypothetical protein